ncbi:MAG: TetR/AcrR family transcriptional regulator [Proteobacteria bacterium]|nr:TetR/AcrR family transcriptional regulator [Pseudomonadota bacterium]
MNTKLDKKKMILDAALDLFSEHGFSHVSMTQVAKKAQVTKSLIFHHFENKRSLWDHVKESIFSAYANAQMNLFKEEKDPIHLIRKSIRSYFDFIKENPKIVRFFTYSHLENDDLCGEMDKPLIDNGSRLIKQAQIDGLMRNDFNPVTLVMMFISGINQYFIAQCHFEHWDEHMYQDSEQFINDFTEILIKGVKP